MSCEKLNQYLQEISHEVKGSQCGELDDILTGITNIEVLLLDTKSTNTSTKVSSAYKQLLNAIIQSGTILRLYGQSKVVTEIIDKIVLQVLHVDSFFILVVAVKELPPSSKLDAILILLKKFLETGPFKQMLMDQSTVIQHEINCQTSYNALWEQLITYIVSLPNRVVDKNLGKLSGSFETERFSELMSQNICSFLEHVYCKLQENENSSTQFLSLLLGRLCLSGFGDCILRTLVPKLLSHIGDFLWLRIIKRFVLGIPDKCMEAFLTPFLAHIPWHGYVECFFGDGVKENITLKFLISKKFLLIRFYNNPDMLWKCIGYLATSKSRQGLFLSVFQNMLDVWSKRSALKHQSDIQHLYLSRGIMVCGAFIQSLNIELPKSVIMRLVLQGVQTHIENPLSSVRMQGMVVGQAISSIVDKEGPKLNFEIEETEETKNLFALLSIPMKIEPCTKQIEAATGVVSKVVVKISANNDTKNLDSDDDLEPYDQTNDTVFQKEKNPVYVQDILDGLIDHGRPEYSHLCLEMAEKIIRTQSHYTNSVTEEIIKVLLHLEDTFAANNFVSSRFRAMVAVTVTAPEKTARYLTDQFYDRNYNIRQRLDILEVLAAASQELSQCTTKNDQPKTVHSKFLEQESTVSHDHWSEIIRKRIESNTRRFGKGCTKKPLEPVANKFALVAGAFFFPLLKFYDKPESTLDLLGEDSYVLGRLIYTLGIICNSAANTIILRQMSKAMLDFIWTLRYHTEVFVRQALLFSLCMVVINVPPNMLLGNVQSDLLEYQYWLQDILEKDPNLECRKWAGKILGLIFKMIKNEEESNP